MTKIESLKVYSSTDALAQLEESPSGESEQASKTVIVSVRVYVNSKRLS